MMLARLGIDKTKSWADQVEEEEELAPLTKNLLRGQVHGAGAPQWRHAGFDTGATAGSKRTHETIAIAHVYAEIQR